MQVCIPREPLFERMGGWARHHEQGVSALVFLPGRLLVFILLCSVPSAAHDGCVRGVAIDALNQHVLTAGADGKLKVRHLL